MCVRGRRSLISHVQIKMVWDGGDNHDDDYWILKAVFVTFAQLILDSTTMSSFPVDDDDDDVPVHPVYLFYFQSPL